MPGAQLPSDRRQQGADEGVGKRSAVLQHDVQYELTWSLSGRGIDDHAVRHAGDAVQHLVELGGTQPDSAAVQGRVRAAIYDH